MSDLESDPVLERVLLAAHVMDAQLQAPDVRQALKEVSSELVAARPRGRKAIQGAATFAVAAAVIVVLGLVTRQSDEPSSSVVAAEFDRVASEFPLPVGVTYEVLKLTSLDSAASREDLRAEVALFSGCAWTAQLTDAGLSEVIPDGVEMKAALRRSYAALPPAKRSALTGLATYVNGLGADRPSSAARPPADRPAPTALSSYVDGLGRDEPQPPPAEARRAWDRFCQDVR